MANIIDKLKTNAVFQLSLSSKELFHSNFLCWLAEDENCSDVFTKVLELFGYAPENAKEIVEGLRDGKYMALREYKNFDFCICEKVKNFKEDEEDEFIPGRILLILENKFKSIPYKEQLEEYQNKVEKLNSDGKKNRAKALWLKNNTGKEPPKWSETTYADYIGSDMNTHFVLLSLAQNICDLDIKEGKTEISVGNDKKVWKVISYISYAEKLKDACKENKGFTFELIKNYAEFILSFHNLLNQGKNHLPDATNISDKPWSILSCRKDMNGIRMDDIWQKLVANIIGIELRKRLTKEGYSIISIKSVRDVLGSNEKMPKPNEIILGTGFTRGTALIEVKLVLNKDILFGIQIQGNAYKRLLEVVQENYDWENVLGDFQGMFRHKSSSWVDPDNTCIFKDDEGVSPKVTHIVKKYPNVPEGFGGYCGKFICQWKNIKNDAKVSEVITAVLADIKKVQTCWQKRYVKVMVCK